MSRMSLTPLIPFSRSTSPSSFRLYSFLWLTQAATTAIKTTSTIMAIAMNIICSSLMAWLSSFLRGPLFKLVCESSTVRLLSLGTCYYYVVMFSCSGSNTEEFCGAMIRSSCINLRFYCIVTNSDIFVGFYKFCNLVMDEDI